MDAFEVAWPNLGIASFGIGPKKITEHYAHIGIHKSRLNLGFYHGASLGDPSRLLEGTGKKLRHAKIYPLEPARVRAVKILLNEAVSDRLKNARNRE